MLTVFVHGAPETAAIWEPLLTEIAHLAPNRPAPVLLSPPGFGAPLPAGFGATVGDYRDWLIGELEQFTEPVDLVGHDWGGAHTLNAVMARPDLVRSWVSDVIGLFDPDYVWHEHARRLQESQSAPEPAIPFSPDPTVRIAHLAGLGMSEPVARQVVKGQNEAMGQAAAVLYRSAAQPVMAEFGRNLEHAARRPGLALIATEDHHVGTIEQRKRAAHRAGARTLTFEGLGHCWMTQDPELGARTLTDFWASL